MDAANPLTPGSDNYSDPWDGDRPVFDPKCPKCARFYSWRTIRYSVNGFGEILNPTANCKRCGTIKPGISHWKSDEVIGTGR